MQRGKRSPGILHRVQQPDRYWQYWQVGNSLETQFKPVDDVGTLSVTSRPVVVPRPSWSQVYYGEALTLSCVIEGGEDFEWNYYWYAPNAQFTGDKYKISYANGEHTGSYSCLGDMKNERASTTWSAALKLTVSNSKSFSHTHMRHLS